MALTSQGFSEDISDLDKYADMRESDNLTVLNFSNGVKINLYMLCLFIGFFVVCMTLVLSTCSGIGCAWVKPSFDKTPCNRIISEHATNMTQYFASVDDLGTESCFLHFHEIRALPRNIHQLVVDFLVLGQLAQLASLYKQSWSEELVGKNKP